GRVTQIRRGWPLTRLPAMGSVARVVACHRNCMRLSMVTECYWQLGSPMVIATTTPCSSMCSTKFWCAGGPRTPSYAVVADKMYPKSTMLKLLRQRGIILLHHRGDPTVIQ